MFLLLQEVFKMCLKCFLIHLQRWCFGYSVLYKYSVFSLHQQLFRVLQQKLGGKPAEDGYFLMSLVIVD